MGDFIKSVRKSGYDVGTVSADIPIKGMQCASCVQTIEKALLQLRGETKTVVNLAIEKVRLEYMPSEISFDEIKKTIEKTGYRVLDIPAEAGLEDAESFIRKKKYRKLKIKFFTGLFLGLSGYHGRSCAHGIFFRSKIRSGKRHPLSRFLIKIYRPVIHFVLKRKILVIVVAVAIVLVSLLPLSRIGSEFMPPLNEGDSPGSRDFKRDLREGNWRKLHRFCYRS